MFAEPIQKDLARESFIARNFAGDEIYTEDWHVYKVSDTEFEIYTELTKDDLPIELELSFSRYEENHNF